MRARGVQHDDAVDGPGAVLVEQHEPLTNASVRERFGISFANRDAASRLIRDAVETGVIVPRDPGAGPGQMQYMPGGQGRFPPEPRPC